MRQKIIDAHTHFLHLPTFKKSRDDLIYSFETYGLSLCLVSYELYENRGKQNVVRKLFYTLKLRDNNPYFHLLLWLPLRYKLSHKEEKFIHQFIVKHKSFVHGIKLHPFMSHTVLEESPNIDFYLSLCREFNFPILSHSATDDCSSLDYLASLARNNPDVDFVSGHIELINDNLEERIHLFKEIPNLYCDTAWVPPHIVKEFEEEGIIHKIMFGTDAPIDGKDTLNHEYYQALLNNEIGLKKENLNKVLYKNALKVYRIKEKDLRNLD